MRPDAEKRLREGSETIMAQFCRGLAKVSPVLAFAVPLSLGGATALVGVVLEVKEFYDLLQTAGPDATRAAITAATDTGLITKMGQLVTGELKSQGLQLLTGGVMVSSIIAPIAGIAVKIAGAFNELRELAEARAPRTLELTPPKISGATRIPGAARLISGGGTDRATQLADGLTRCTEAFAAQPAQDAQSLVRPLSPRN